MEKMTRRAIDEATDDAQYFNVQTGDLSLKEAFAKSQQHFPKMTWEMYLNNMVKLAWNNSRISQVHNLPIEAENAYKQTYLAAIVKYDEEHHSK